MHIPDGLLDVRSAVGAALISGATFAYGLRRVRRDLPDRAAPLMGVTAACLFAAQMVNVPLLIAPTSGHLLGGGLAAILLGPWGGMLVVAAVLVVQCLLFQDGGLTAFGANFLVLGVIGSGVGYATFALVRRWLPGPRGIVAGAAVASWFSVLLGAVTASILIAVGPNFALRQILGVMLVAHSLIGLGEALITGLAVSFVLRTRPDLIYAGSHAPGIAGRTVEVLLGGGAIAFVLAVIASPFASALPDGLEHSLGLLGLEGRTTEATISAPFADYGLPGFEHLAMASSAVAALGVLAVFVLAYVLARSVGSKLVQGHTSDAS